MKQSWVTHISAAIGLWKISMWPLYYHHILAAGKLESIDPNITWLKGATLTSLMWVTWLRSSSVSLEGSGSKIQKVSICRPAVSNETILATKHEFLFTKVAHVQRITDIVLSLD